MVPEAMEAVEVEAMEMTRWRWLWKRRTLRTLLGVGRAVAVAVVLWRCVVISNVGHARGVTDAGSRMTRGQAQITTWVMGRYGMLLKLSSWSTQGWMKRL